jgi:hypothetical protein
LQVGAETVEVATGFAAYRTKCSAKGAPSSAPPVTDIVSFSSSELPMLEIMPVSSSELVIMLNPSPKVVEVATLRPTLEAIVVESTTPRAPDAGVLALETPSAGTSTTETPAVGIIPEEGELQEARGSINKAMEVAAPTRADQEYPLDVMVSSKALVAEEARAETSTGGRVRTHELAMEELQREEAERQACMDTVLGGLGLLHRVSSQIVFPLSL